MAAPVIAASTATAGSNSIAVPSGVASGSLVVVKIFGGWFGATAPTMTCITAPSGQGWQNGPGAAFHDTADSAYGYEAWFYKYATASDTGTYAFTVNTVGGSAAFATFGGWAARVTGITSGDPFVDTFRVSGTTTSSPGPWSVASFTPTAANTLLIGGQFCFSAGSGTLTGPSGWTGVSTSASNGFGIFSLAQTTAAATGSLSFGAITDQGWASVVSLRASSPTTGTVAATLGAVTVAATGTDSSDNTGSVSVTLGKTTASVSGTATASGTASVTVPKTTLSANDLTPMAVIRAALAEAEAGTGQARVLFLGDSIEEGEGATTAANRSSAKTIAGLRSRNGVSGGGAGMLLSYQATSLSDSAAWRDPMSSSSGLVSNAWFSTQGRRGADYDAVNDFGEWTVQGTAVDFVALHGTGDGGSFSVSVDGGSPTVIDTSSGSLTCSVPTRISLGASGSHTVKATLTAGEGAVDGLVIYDGDESVGVTWWDCTHGGYSSQDFANIGFADYRLAWNTFDPHLIVDNATGIGDYNGGDTLDQFTGNLTDRLNVYAALPSVPNVILLYTYKLSSQQTSTNSVGLTVQDYFDAATEVAASYPNVTVLDLNTVYPNFAGTSGWLASDNGHPSDLGHQAIADALIGAVMGPTAGTVAIELGMETVSVSGHVSQAGSAAATLGATQAAASGQLFEVGTASAALGSTTMAASGQVNETGAVAATLQPVTVNISGAVIQAGTVAAALEDTSLEASGELVVSGSAAAVLPSTEMAASGQAIASGSATAQLEDASVAASGTVIVTGSAAATLPAVVLVASSSSSVPGTAAVQLGVPEVVASGQLSQAGSVSVELESPILEATSSGLIVGTAAVELAMPAMSTLGQLVQLGEASATLPSSSASASGAVVQMGSASATLPPVQVNASAGPGVVRGSVAVLLGPAQAIASGQVIVTARASVILDVPQALSPGQVMILGVIAVVLGVISAAASEQVILAHRALVGGSVSQTIYAGEATPTNPASGAIGQSSFGG